MTKGQKIIVSLLVVVAAVWLVVNRSLAVTAQDPWNDDHREQVRALEDLRLATAQAAQAIIDAQARATAAADQRAWEARLDANHRAFEARNAADLRAWDAAWQADRAAQPAASSAGYQDLKITVQVLWEKLIETRGDLRELKWDVVQLKDDVAKLSFGVHVLELKHVWDGVPAAERAAMEKAFGELLDELPAAEKQKEAPDD